MSEPTQPSQGVPPTSSGPLSNAFEPIIKWMGRMVTWVKTELNDTDKKTETKVLEIQSKPIQIDSNQKQALEKYQHNYDTILKIDQSDVQNLKVEHGTLIQDEKPSTEKQREEGKQFVQQTYRQAWGKLIDAQHGFGVEAGALQKLNVLKDHLVKVYPEGIPRTEPEKLLFILLESYPDQEMPPILEAVRVEQRAKTAHNVDLVAQDRLHYKELTGADKGMNPTQFVIEKATGQKLAIAKSANEQGLAEAVAEQQGVDNPTIFGFLGGFQELAASFLNILFGGRLGIPLAKPEKSSTLHAFVENVGNFHDFIEKRGREALQQLPTAPAQRFVFTQLITRNEDCHGENILFTSAGDPIPIDFGRVLNPDRAIRACYLEFSCLDQPINPEDKRFYETLEVEATMGKLSALLQRQYPDQFADPITNKAITLKLNLLKARLYMIKEGVKAGLNQRQLIALELPPLTQELEAMYRKFKQEEGQWHDEEPSADLIGGPNTDLFGGYLARKGFQAAWNRSYNPHTNTFDASIFLPAIRAAIAEVQAIPLAKLYTSREKELYAAANYDWTNLPRLDLS